MPIEFLDRTGLSYLWSKLKLAFAAIVHVHASSDVSAMTGYSKPLSGSAISSSDTLNQAVGKLEAKIDAYDDSDYVHKTGTETVDGFKSFLKYLTVKGASDFEGVIVRSEITANTNHIRPIVVTNTENSIISRYFVIRTYPKGVDSNDVSTSYISALTGDGTNNIIWSTLMLGIDSNSIPYAGCPSTSTTRTAGTDIVTRNFIPVDTRIVHTTGNEEISGTKTFTSVPQVLGNYPSFVLRNSIASRGTAPSSGSSYLYDIVMLDKEGSALTDRYGLIECRVTDSNMTQMTFAVYANTVSTILARMDLMTFNGSGARVQTPDLMPSANNTYYLGGNSQRWKDVFAVNTTIGTSDRRVKMDISSIPEQVLDAWDGVSWIRYKFIDAVGEKGDAARFHTGAIAQDMEDAFRSAGLDARAYGFFCYDAWGDIAPSYDENGGVAFAGQKAGDMYSLRYVEALCIEAAYQRRENARLKKRMADLEDRLAALELKVS